MDVSATGLILRTRPLTETSLVVHWLTAEHGRLATVAKGARRPKSPFRGKLDLFFLADFGYLPSRRSSLHLLREVTVRETHAGLRRDLALLQQASYAVQLVEQATETDTPLPGPFQLLSDLLDWLPHHAPSPVPVLAFELRLLEESGLAPDPGETRLSPAGRTLLRQLAVIPWTELAPGLADPAAVAEVRRFLQVFLGQHLGRVPAGRTAALG
ncbi:MAG: repair protein RecO [Verrucomicrobiota bacterium]|jgi:DNA repair protein RecO (recombination protein O)